MCPIKSVSDLKLLKSYKMSKKLNISSKSTPQNMYVYKMSIAKKYFYVSFYDEKKASVQKNTLILLLQHAKTFIYFSPPVTHTLLVVINQYYQF